MSKAPISVESVEVPAPLAKPPEELSTKEKRLQDLLVLILLTSKAPISVKSVESITPLAKTAEELRIEEKSLQDLLVLIEAMFLREEITIKLIIDCLYDIGTVNVINKKVQRRPLNGMAKYIARLSKPVFRIVAWRWFTKNTPKLLVDWLYRKVSKV